MNQHMEDSAWADENKISLSGSMKRSSPLTLAALAQDCHLEGTGMVGLVLLQPSNEEAEQFMQGVWQTIQMRHSVAYMLHLERVEATVSGGWTSLETNEPLPF